MMQMSERRITTVGQRFTRLAAQPTASLSRSELRKYTNQALHSTACPMSLCLVG